MSILRGGQSFRSNKLCFPLLKRSSFNFEKELSLLNAKDKTSSKYQVKAFILSWHKDCLTKPSTAKCRTDKLISTKQLSFHCLFSSYDHCSWRISCRLSPVCFYSISIRTWIRPLSALTTAHNVWHNSCTAWSWLAALALYVVEIFPYILTCQLDDTYCR